MCAPCLNVFFMPLSHISVGKSDHDSSHPPYLGLFLIATEVSPGPGPWFTEQNTNTINHTEGKEKKKMDSRGSTVSPGFSAHYASARSISRPGRFVHVVLFSCGSPINPEGRT